MRSRFSLVVVCLTWFFAQPPGLNAQELEFETFLITTFGSLGFVTGRDYAGNPLDLNWDGKVDFLVAYRSGDYVSSFISDGPTEYRETQTAIEGRRPFTLAVADLDRDYLNDVVTANDQSGSLSVLHGAGFGSFPLGFEIPQAGAPRSIVAADFDGDGWVDVAYATIGAPVAIHVLANEFGALNPTPVYMQYFSGRLGYVAAPDMDRDGDPDLVVVTTDFFTGFIDVFRNEGGALFEHFDSILLPFPVNPRTLATGDLNGDGYMDVAVGNWLPDESVDAFFVLNDGEGRFDLDTVSVIEVPGIGESVTIDDFNLDTHADLAVSADGNFPFGVTIFLNDGAANFDPTASVQLNSGDRPRWLTSVDIDGDGDVDLASANLDFVGLIVHQNLFMESALAVEVVALATEGGAGHVASTPTRELCVATEAGETCAQFFSPGTELTYQAVAAPGSTFVGWSERCTGTEPTCTFTVDDSLPLAVANFIGPRPLFVDVIGTEGGMGSVLLEDDGRTCENGTCIFELAVGTTVTLIATPDPGSTFDGWNGLCTGTDATCTFTMEADEPSPFATASFLGPRILFVDRRSIEGGSGSIRVDPPNESCKFSSCRYEYPAGTLVTLTATAEPDSIFSGWTGACTGSALTCEITLEASVPGVFAEANFTGPRYLDVAIQATRDGRGSVFVDPPSAVCDNITGVGLCQYAYRPTTVVTLTASADLGSVFEGWEGGCIGTDPTCEIVLTTDTGGPVAVAKFHGPKILGIEVAGINGAKGFVTADPPGVTCANEGAPSAGCQYSYPPGALVTLTANAAPGDVFLGWADACTGEDTTCDVVIDDTFVTATFARPIIVASRIAEKYGDVQERSDGRIQSKNKNLELSRKRIVGLRFPVLGIPQGAKITSAYVQFEADKLESRAVQLFIAAQAHDDAPPFTKARRGVSTRELTSEVVWSPLPWNTVGEAGPAQRAPALASIVQEVVARSGWTAASSLVLIVRGEGSSKRAAESFEGKRESAPLVHIEYVIIP